MGLASFTGEVGVPVAEASTVPRIVTTLLGALVALLVMVTLLLMGPTRLVGPQCNYKNADEAQVCNLCSNSLKGVLPGAGMAKKLNPNDAMLMYEPRSIHGGGAPGAPAGLNTTKRFQPGGGAAGLQPNLAPGQDDSGPPMPFERKLKPMATNTVRHYVLPPTGAPILLESGKTYVLGRDEAATIRIQSPKVSRRHCEIRWEGTPPHPVLFDLGSQNGSFVNGECLTANSKRTLVDRDLVEIGGVGARYRLLQPGESESELRSGEAAETTLVSEQEEAGLVGNVALLPLSEVLARLAKLGATGLLVVEAGGAKGALRIEGGTPVAGSFAGLEAQAAIAAVSNLTQGRFRFEVQDDDEGESASAGTVKLAPGTASHGKAPPAPPAGGKPTAPPKPPGTTTRPAPPRRPEELG